jgi:hypothetical protein
VLPAPEGCRRERGIMTDLAKAQMYEQSALHLCRRGDHHQASQLFATCAKLYERAGDWYMASHCDGQAAAERRQLRPSAPVNISALVD